MYKSKIYWELRERYITKKLQPFVLVGAIVWMAWMWQMIMATGLLASDVVYFLY